MVDVAAAGKAIPRGPGAKECFSPPANQPVTPEAVRRLRYTTHPEPGHQRMAMYPTNSDTINSIRHGVNTKTSLEARELLNPARQTKFRQQLNNLQEQVYISRQKAPLGHSHNQTHGLPKGMDTQKATFGTVTVKDVSAGELVSPAKTSAEVEQESTVGSDLYKKSHQIYDVGEMVDRDYDWSTFTRDSQYGVPTPHDNSGSGVRSAMKWITASNDEKRAPIVSKQVEDFRERTHPKLGTVHDPIADTLNVDSDHTFGVMIRPDQFSAGDLVTMTGPSAYLQCSHFDRGVLSSIRQHLKNNHFHNFPALLDAALLYKGGAPSTDDVKELFFQFQVPLEPEMLEVLLTWCSSGDSGTVACEDLIELMNWKEEIREETIKRLSTAQGTIDKDPSAVVLNSSYKTCSQTIKATVGSIPTNNYRSYGVPTVRGDRPAPRIRRVGDHTNYGDESDAYGLMYPSVYSNCGVYEQDFFAPLPPDELRQIFQRIGVEMSDKAFEAVWNEASSRDPNGQVCVELFRVVLEENQDSDIHP